MSFDLALYRSPDGELPVDAIVDVLVNHGAVVTAEDAVTFFADEEEGLADAQVVVEDLSDPEDAEAFPSFEFEDGQALEFTFLSVALTFDPSQVSSAPLFKAIEELEDTFDIWVLDFQTDSPGHPEKLTADELTERYNASASRAQELIAEVLADEE